MTGFVGRDEVAEVLSSRTTFLTFAGVETFLMFQQNFPLREFCAFEVYQRDEEWRAMQDRLLRPVADVAAEHGCGVITDTLTWRASADYVRKLGYEDRAVATINADAVERTRVLVRDWQARSRAARETPVILAADIGPRGDGYGPAEGAPESFYAYHREQVQALADAGVDMLAGWTITSVNEALGIARAARDCALPLLMSATVETDGRLPDETSLGEFIESVDAATDGYPLFYAVNCAHPTHLAPTLEAAGKESAPWLERFRGFRTNASCKSHEELDDSTSLDRGDVGSLANQVADLKRRYHLMAIGGCCGTDVEHLRAIADACTRQLTY